MFNWISTKRKKNAFLLLFSFLLFFLSHQKFAMTSLFSCIRTNFFFLLFLSNVFHRLNFFLCEARQDMYTHTHTHTHIHATRDKRKCFVVVFHHCYNLLRSNVITNVTIIICLAVRRPYLYSYRAAATTKKEEQRKKVYLQFE